MVHLHAMAHVEKLIDVRPPRYLQAFFADIYAEAKRAKPSAGHRALAGLAAQGKLQRHYTLNIDGLAQAVGLSTWHPDKNPAGGSLLHVSAKEGEIACLCKVPSAASSRHIMQA